MSTVPVITDWGTAFLTSIAAAMALLLAAVPRALAFAAICLVGWMISRVLGAAAAAVLRAVGFNDLARRSGVSGLFDRLGLHHDATGLLAALTRWFVRLIVLVVAFDALGLPAVSAVLHQLLLWIPNLVVALVVLVGAGLGGTALAATVRRSSAATGSSGRMLARFVQVAVWFVGVLIALSQVGVATMLVQTLFMGVVGALALSFGLAFGLGGRETAALIVRDWYERGRLTGGRTSPERVIASTRSMADRAPEVGRPEYADPVRTTDAA